MDLTNPQIIMRDKEIAQLRAENSQIKNDLAAAQATIAEMREALDCLFANEDEKPQYVIKALALPANHDGLLEALAKECERLANEIGANNGLVIEPYVWLRGEAAAHRARKERK